MTAARRLRQNIARYSNTSLTWVTIAWLFACPWLLFPAVMPLLTATALVLLLLTRYFLWRRHGRMLPATYLDGFIAVYLFFIGVAFLISPLPQLSLPKLTVTILGVFGYYLAQEWLTGSKRIEQLVTVLGVAAGAIALLGLFTMQLPARQVIDLQAVIGRLPHLGGNFTISANELAGTLLFLLPFVVAMLGWPQRQWQRLLAIVILLMLAFTLLLSQSRGAFLGVIFVVLAWFFWGRLGSVAKPFFLFVVLSAVFLPLIVAGANLGDLPGLLSKIDLMSKTGADQSWLGRVEIWRAGINMLRDYPVFGAGLYVFEPVSRANYEFAVIPPNLPFTHAHNVYLQAGATLGIAGMLALIGLWLSAIYGLLSANLADERTIRRLAAIFGASLVGYLFFNLFDAITLGQKPGFLVWLVLAGSVSISQLAHSRSEIPDRPAPITRGHYLAAIPLIIFLALLLAPALDRNRSNLKLDQLVLAGREPSSTLSAADFPRDARRSGLISYLNGERSAALVHWQADSGATTYLLNQAKQATHNENLPVALEWFGLALLLDQNPAEIYFQRGLAYERFDMFAEAQADFESAGRYAVTANLDAFWQSENAAALGRVLSRQEKWAEAAGAYERAISLDHSQEWYYKALGKALEMIGDEEGAAAVYEAAQDAG